jgi:probable rRNA maturation factor
LVIIEKSVAGLSANALSRFVLRARSAAKLRGTVNVFITTSSAMKSLNAKFRRKNKATDVLSFPSEQTDHRRGMRFAGEVAISADIAADNAKRLGHTTALEIKVLVLHGILHLAGFDHERDNGEMAQLEAKLRRTMNLPAALIERTHSDSRTSAKGTSPPRRSRRTA